MAFAYKPGTVQLQTETLKPILLESCDSSIDLLLQLTLGKSSRTMFSSQANYSTYDCTIKYCLTLLQLVQRHMIPRHVIPFAMEIDGVQLIRHAMISFKSCSHMSKLKLVEIWYLILMTTISKSELIMVLIILLLDTFKKILKQLRAFRSSRQHQLHAHPTTVIVVIPGSFITMPYLQLHTLTMH